MRVLAVLTVRNEAAFLLEWLAHHMAAGFTGFLVYSNDCQDGTDTLLDALDNMGVLTHVRNEGPYEGGIQWHALKQASKQNIVKEANWILPLDIDEFVNIHTGDHTVSALIKALPDATAITLTWRLFGNNGVTRYLDEPVSEQFNKAAPTIMNWPWRASMFKTLFRNDGTYKKLGVHRPRSPDPDKINGARWFDCQGRELDDRFRRQRLFSPFGRDNFKLAQLNHYPLGSMESYLLKRDRGRAVHDADLLGMDYWVDRNWNTDEDTSIGNLASQKSHHLQHFMAQKTIAKLHERAVQWRKDRFAELMQQEPFRALYGRLLVTPPSQPLPVSVAKFMFQFAQNSQKPTTGSN